MRSEHDPPRASGTTGADIDEALTRAETLMAAAEHAGRTCRMFLAAEAGTVALAVVAIVLSIALGQGVSAARLAVIAAVILLLGVLLAGAIHLTLTIPSRHRVRRDARATMEIIDFVREVYGMVSRREGWSETRLRVVKARMSRFPVDASAIH